MSCFRPIAFGAAALLCVHAAAPAAAAPTTLADLLPGGLVSSIQDYGLTFSNFKPLLAATPVSGSALLTALVSDPGALAAMPLLDPSGGGVLSYAFGNALQAAASDIAVSPLADDPANPGLRFAGPTTWSVTAGNIASLQLTGFFYDVTRDPTSGPIRSASLAQDAAAAANVTVGPDSFPSAGLPDFALGGAMQFVFDSTGLIGGNATGELFARLDWVGVLPAAQLASDFSFADRDSVRVYNLIAVGASSEGAYTLGSLSERYDPPASGPYWQPPLPGSVAVPEPAPLLLLATAALAVGFSRRRLA